MKIPEREYDDNGFWIVTKKNGKKKVLCCKENISKMSFLQYVYYDIFHWGCLLEVLLILIGNLKDVVTNLLTFILNIIITIFVFPILYPFKAMRDIKGCQEIMDKKLADTGLKIQRRYENLREKHKGEVE